MTDISKDLAALRIPHEERGGRRAPVGLIVVVLLVDRRRRGRGLVLEYPDADGDRQGRAGHGESRRAGGRRGGAERLGLRHGAAPRDGLVQGHRQGHRGPDRGRAWRSRKGRSSRAWTTRSRAPRSRSPRRSSASAQQGRGRGRGAARAGGSSRSNGAQQLLKEGVVGKAELDEAQAEVDSLKARIAYAAAAGRRRREPGRGCSRPTSTDTVIRAPFSGVAISKDAQPGEMVSPVSAGGGFTRTGICTIVDMTSLEIEVDVNETYINRVHDRQNGRGGARRLSGLADPGARDHDGADGRSAEGHGARCGSASTRSTRGSCPTWA